MFGEGIGPFHAIVPVDRVDWVFRSMTFAFIPKCVAVGQSPGSDFVPKPLGHFMGIDGKSGEGDFVPGSLELLIGKSRWVRLGFARTP